MRLWNVLVISVAVAGSLSVSAGAKDDFINAVTAQCKVAKDKAATWATPGRAGNVIKFKVGCKSGSTVEVEGCTLQCKDASSNIGG